MTSCAAAAAAMRSTAGAARIIWWRETARTRSAAARAGIISMRGTTGPLILSTAAEAETFAWRTPRIIEAAATSRLVPADANAVPILMYHVIAHKPPGARFPDLYVPRAVFAAQMRTLAANGYHVVTLQEVYDHWHGAPLPRKPVVVSFDDGFRNQYTHALPHPERLRLGRDAQRRRRSPGRAAARGSRTRQVAAMINAGWEIDSHTPLAHADPHSLGPATLWHEVAGSRAYLPGRVSCARPLLLLPVRRLHNVRDHGRAPRRLPLHDRPPATGLATPAAAFTLPRIRVTAQTTLTNLASLNRFATHRRRPESWPGGNRFLTSQTAAQLTQGPAHTHKRKDAMTSRITRLSTLLAALAATVAVGVLPSLAEGAQTQSSWAVNHPLLGQSNHVHADRATRQHGPDEGAPFFIQPCTRGARRGVGQRHNVRAHRRAYASLQRKPTAKWAR